MRKLLTLTFFAALLSTNIQGQTSTPTSRPKVGLTLSGGAAKGIAHISLLKAIDSLGIHVDYITGTSMGAIIGGLYAIGYSGKELEWLVLNEDWDAILSNQTSLRDIHIDEKSEYGRYLTEMAIQNHKIQLPTGMNEGQNLMTLLHRLTAKVAHIHDFNKFPIPFKCMAADIVSGEGVVLDSGDLAMAMRASMAIPTVFTPVDWGGEGLMVDGGLVHNFPVDLVCSMGADIVIGSYTGGRLYTKNQLNSLIRLLYQSASFRRASESIEQQKLCQILFSSDDALRNNNLKVSDFNKSKRILAVGDSIIQWTLPQLKALAEAQQQFDIQRPHVDSVIASYILDKTFEADHNKFNISQIAINGIDDYKKEVALRYLQIDLNQILSTHDILKAINRLYSSNLYKKVFYEIQKTTDSTFLVINVEEKPASIIKVGLHFDNELGSGITLNWTRRDLIGENSRLIIAADVAQSPKLRAHLHKKIKQSSWSSNIATIYERTSEPLIFEDQTLGSYGRQQNQVKVYLSRSFGQSSELSIGGVWNVTDYKPLYYINDKIYIRDKRPDSVSQLSMLRSSTFAAYLNFRKNTLNYHFMPDKGYSIVFDVRYGFFNRFAQEVRTVYSKPNIVSEPEKIRSSIPYFWRTTLSFESATPLSRRVCLTLKSHSGWLWGNNFVRSNQLVGENFLLGGIEQRQSPNHFPFAGNREASTRHTAFGTAQIAMRFEVINNIFLAPQGSVMISDKNTTVWSSGLTIAFRTPLAPLQVSINKADNDSRWRPYFAVGYRF